MLARKGRGMSGATTSGHGSGSVQRLLEGKLHPPSARPKAVVRRRLLERLDASASAALTLVSAPVGFGKTMLVQSWCAGHAGEVAWVSLDPADDDPSRLWAYVACSLERVGRGLGQTALHRLRSPGVPPELVIDAVVDALQAQEKPVTIVLDDLHAISSPVALGSLTYALERLPAHARVVATARRDPDLPLARLRARTALAEIRTSELAFTVDEAQELLVERERLPLDDADVEALVERTEGWPAGLYLAALWLRDLDDPKAGVAGFRGDQRHVADYLTSEVLATLDDDARRFLLETATLGAFSTALADAVLGRSDSAARLTELERTNGFLVALDESGGWYRYHHLFGQLLERELSRREPATAARIHLGASEWLRRDGRLDEALGHAAAADDSRAVLEILAGDHMALIRSGRLATLLGWCDRLSREKLLEQPAVAIGAVLAAGLLGQPAHLRHRYAAVAMQARSTRPDAWTDFHEAALGIARTTWVESNLGEAIALARSTLALARKDDEVGVPALASLAAITFLAGEHAEARALAQEALHRPEAPERAHGSVGALATLSLLDGQAGAAPAAERRAREAIEVARIAGIDESASGGLARVALAAALAPQGQLREAAVEAAHGERLRRHQDPELGHVHALLVLADVRARRGELDLARAHLAQVRRTLGAARDAGVLPSLADGVERTIDSARSGAASPSEPPTDAELNVLHLLDTTLTQREIGARLYVSVNTVKTHTRALYRKLGVSSREAAVERARAIGLLGGEPAD